MLKTLPFFLFLFPLALCRNQGTIQDHYRDAVSMHGQGVVDYDTAYRFGEIESSHSMAAIARACLKRNRGKDRDCARGALQVKPSTALYHCGIKDRHLLNTKIGIYCGVIYLAWIKKRERARDLHEQAGFYYQGPTGYRRARLQRTPKERKKWLAINRYVVKLEAVEVPVTAPAESWWIYGTVTRYF